MATVLVDANNVRRSVWPNIGAATLRDLGEAWALLRGHELELVFDEAESADDAIVRRADELRSAGRPFWLVTSDRELRERAGGGAVRLVGGGTFARELLRSG